MVGVIILYSVLSHRSDFVLHFPLGISSHLVGSFSSDLNDIFSHYILVWFRGVAKRGGAWGLEPPQSEAQSLPWAPKCNDTLYRGLWRTTILSLCQPLAPLAVPSIWKSVYTPGGVLFKYALFTSVVLSCLLTFFQYVETRAGVFKDGVYWYKCQ